LTIQGGQQSEEIPAKGPEGGEQGIALFQVQFRRGLAVASRPSHDLPDGSLRGDIPPILPARTQQEEVDFGQVRQAIQHVQVKGRKVGNTEERYSPG